MTEKDTTPQSDSDQAVAAAANGDGEFNMTFALDIEKYLAPCPGDNPAGESLRYEGTYDLIQEARKEEDADLPQGIWERSVKKANWEQVNKLCLEALENRSKDIQVAAWLTEALILTHGYAGFNQGVRLLRALIEKFWDDAYPEIEDDDLGGRLAPIIWLNEKVSLKLKLIPITMPRSMDSQPYSFADWESANLLEKLAVKDPNAIDNAELEGRATRAKFLGSVMFTDGSFYAGQAQNILRSLEALDDLNTFLDNKCPEDAPSVNMLKENLENILGLVNSFLKEKQVDIPTTDLQLEADGPDGPEADAQSDGPLSTLSIKSRDDAYRMLAAAADYLLIHEPHSPTPHLVRRAVTWGKMSLTELLRELIQDDSNLRQIFKLLGVKYAPVKEEIKE